LLSKYNLLTDKLSFCDVDNSYLDFVGTGSQNWTLKSLNPTYPSFTIDLGTPQNNNENIAPNKDIWVLPFTGVNIPELVGVPNGNEYAFYLTKIIC
jgi:hypothetical protein